MRIPNDAGGTAIARGPALPEVGQRGQRTAAALGNAAQTMGAIGQDMIQEDAKRKDAADRLEAGKVLLEHRAAVSDLLNGAREGLRTGQLKDENEARAFFDDGLAELDGVELPSVGEFVKQDLQLSMADAKQRAGAGLDDVLRGHRTDRIKTTTLASLGALNKEAISPTANLSALEAQIDATITTAAKADSDLDPAWLEGQRQNAKTSAWGNHVARRIELGENSMDELKAVERDLTAGDGKYAGKLQAEDNNTLLARVRSAKDRLTAKWEQASAKRDASAKRVLDQYQAVYSSGFPVGNDLREQARKATKGTEYEQAFNDAMADESAVGEMLKMPVADQQAFIVQRERELRTGKVNDPKEISRFNALATAFQRNIKTMTESPMEWNETRTGDPVPRISAPMLLDTNGIEVAVKVLRDRVVTLDATSKQFGVNVKAPLFKEEADQLGAILKQQSPTVRAQTLGVLAKAIDDPEVFKGAVKQMLGDDPRAFAAGLASGLNLKASDGRRVDELIEYGKDVLKDKTVIKPKSGETTDGSRAMFDAMVGSATPYGTSEREMYYESALSIYAARAAQKSLVGSEIDKDLWRYAVNAATGGVADFGGQKFIVTTHGMNESDFIDSLKIATNEQAKRNGYDYRDLIDMKYVPHDTIAGVYFLTPDEGYSYVPDRNGNKLMIDTRNVKNPIPSRRAIGEAAKISSVMFSGGL